MTGFNWNALKAGEVLVTATAVGTSLNTTCRVQVAELPPTGIRFSKDEEVMEVGQQLTLVCVVEPAHATYKALVWMSSDNSVATVRDGVVEGIRTGKARVTVSIPETELSARCEITVKPVSVKGVSLDKTTLTLLEGSEERLACTVSPANAADRSVDWVSSDPHVASVDQDGKVVGMSRGDAVITVITRDGSHAASCAVQVREITECIDLYFPSITVSSVNEYVTGTIYSCITNHSPADVVLTCFEIKETVTERVVKKETSSLKLGTLASGASATLGGMFTHVYKPQFVWTFTYKGKEYSVRHAYE